jgi:acyl-coenzyme A thioesterase PaaI-like protein
MTLPNHPQIARHLLNFWPPFLGAGIHVTAISKDWRKVAVELRAYGLNRNNMGTHFGGSLYAMTDPFYALMVIQNLGRQYNVWDKAASIEYVKPVKERVTAVFVLENHILDRIRCLTANGDKHFQNFNVEVTDKSGNTVARVHKTIYIRRKR